MIRRAFARVANALRTVATSGELTTTDDDTLLCRYVAATDAAEPRTAPSFDAIACAVFVCTAP